MRGQRSIYLDRWIPNGIGRERETRRILSLAARERSLGVGNALASIRVAIAAHRRLDWTLSRLQLEGPRSQRIRLEFKFRFEVNWPIKGRISFRFMIRCSGLLFDERIIISNDGDFA